MHPRIEISASNIIKPPALPDEIFGVECTIPVRSLEDIRREKERKLVVKWAEDKQKLDDCLNRLQALRISKAKGEEH